MSEKRIQSVSKALRLLTVLSGNPAGLRLTEISEVCGLGPSTTHLLLATLADFDFVELTERGVYRLGLGAYRVGATVAEVSHLSERLRPGIEKLSADCQEVVSIAVRRECYAVIVLRHEVASILRADIRVGTQMPLHASASGKYFLAALDRDPARRAAAAADAAGVYGLVIRPVRQAGTVVAGAPVGVRRRVRAGRRRGRLRQRLRARSGPARPGGRLARQVDPDPDRPERRAGAVPDAGDDPRLRPRKLIAAGEQPLLLRRHRDWHQRHSPTPSATVKPSAARASSPTPSTRSASPHHNPRAPSPR